MSMPWSDVEVWRLEERLLKLPLDGSNRSNCGALHAPQLAAECAAAI